MIELPKWVGDFVVLVILLSFVEYEIKRVKAWVKALVGTVQPKSILKAESFVLVDAKGRERARLCMAEPSEFVVESARLTAESEKMPILALLDEDGASANFFALTPNGPTLRLSDRSSNQIVLTVGYAEGDASVGISGTDGSSCVMGMNTDHAKKLSAASVVLSKNGEVLWSAP